STTDTINSALGGTGTGLTKSGDGTLILGGVNTFTGNVAVNAGTLSINSDARLGNASNNVTLGGGAGLEATATFTSSRTFTLNGGGPSGIVGFSIPDSVHTVTLNAGIAGGTLTLLKSGDGTLVLGAASARTGLN